MKIIVVLLTHIDNLPPARNLLLSMSKIDVNVELITMYSDALPERIKNASNIHVIDVQKEEACSKVQALVNRVKRRQLVRNTIKKIANLDDVIWTVTDYDAMEVGKIQNQFRHVTQLMELIHDIPYFDELPQLKAHIYKYAQTADMVIVPEYNRAHIQKAYWNLKGVPRVIPNKPTVEENDMDIDEVSGEAAEVLRKIGDRKIILYQGTFGYERVLDQFIEAVESLGDSYCMLLMGRNDNELQKLLKKYPKTFFIPFISAPNHLLVTKRAHIGVLSYINTSGIRYYDPLNALYCAPNKLYEYACFGVPMIGNDIPGLEIPFAVNGIGRVAELNSDSIANAIKQIDENYETMKKNCIAFYNQIDMDNLVEEIVTELKGKR